MSQYQPHSAEQSTHQVNKSAFVQQLKQIIPANNIIADAESLKAYDSDALSLYQVVPWLVVLPETNAQAQAIVKLCQQQAVPLVARGAGTGLSGGALPIANGVLLSLAKFTQILQIDVNNRCIHVQAGVRNLAVSQAVEQYGLYYAPDPSSQLACTIGGNIAENSGGVHCLKYGLTTHNVLAVTLLTIDGDIITLGGAGLDSAGYDVLSLVIGSEGLLGIVLDAVLKLLPVPETSATLLALFDSIAQAGSAVAGIISAGIIPAGLELMDNLAIRAAEAYIHAGYPVHTAALLLCELDGAELQVATEVSKAEQVLQQHGATAVYIARDANERQKLWAGRKASFTAIGRLSSDYYCMDGTIPRQKLAYVLTRIADLAEQAGLAVANVFHAGDGNLHPLILYDANEPNIVERVETLGQKILQLCLQVGGTITGEHGVGMEKLNGMCQQFNTEELQQFQRIKQAFDSHGLLNVGKAIPSLPRCAEFGALHVHHGRVPHADLPRF